MKFAAQIGISLSDFWEMTPYELNLYGRGYADRLETQSEITTKSNMLLAYLISRWVWAKRVNIKKYLQADGKPRKMSDKEMFEKVQALNMLLGGSVIQKTSTE